MPAIHYSLLPHSLWAAWPYLFRRAFRRHPSGALLPFLNLFVLPQSLWHRFLHLAVPVRVPFPIFVPGPFPPASIAAPVSSMLSLPLSCTAYARTPCHHCLQYSCRPFVLHKPLFSILLSTAFPVFRPSALAVANLHIFSDIHTTPHEQNKYNTNYHDFTPLLPTAIPLPSPMQSAAIYAIVRVQSDNQSRPLSPLSLTSQSV